MPASQEYITTATPLGATLLAGGATFRCWAPNALAVYIALGHPRETPGTAFPKSDDTLLVKDGDGIWSGFMPDVRDGDLYRFYVVGSGSEGFKRDPRARELEAEGFTEDNCNCVVCDPHDYPWHDAGYTAPAFADLIVYQFHIGVFYARDDDGRDIRRDRVCKILDVVDRIEYFADLGINAIMPLPFQEYPGSNSLGYNGTDLYAPEMDYAVPAEQLDDYLPRVNRLLEAKGQVPLAAAQLAGQVAQFKAFIDLCHLYGIAVIADVVYNHAGGKNDANHGFGDQSLWFFDRQPRANENDSLYFTDEDHAGGRVFAFKEPQVDRFLIDNARMLLDEYHVDGLRYDQVTVIARSGGWFFAQNLADSVRAAKPDAVQIAEYWDVPDSRWKGVAVKPFGMGFDIGYTDMLRNKLRGALIQAAGGRDAHVDLDPVRDALCFTYRDGARWSAFNCLENHDVIDFNHRDTDGAPRIPRVAGGGDARSWYARSRTKVVTGLLLTAPGVPMIFMGEEFLEDKYWTDWQGRPELLIWWDGLEDRNQTKRDKAMVDQRLFTRELMWLRRTQPALRGEGLNVFHVHNGNRVIAFHRWLPGIGRDVVVVASLNESTFYGRGYRIGFPDGGHWSEIFNSDIYDTWPNPNAQGNAGGVTADGPGWDGLPTSGQITLPANSLIVFARDG